MYQGTTPAVTFTIKGYDLTDMSVYVTFMNNRELLTKTDVVVTFDNVTETSTIVCRLSQEETLAMKKGNVKAQIRFIDENNQAYATEKADINIDDVLYQEVIEYTGDGE